MTLNFDIELEERNGPVYYFKAKEKYTVRINTEKGIASCDCKGETFRMSGRKQNHCKHIKYALKLLELKWS